MAERSTRDPKIKGLNPITGTGKDKMMGKSWESVLLEMRQVKPVELASVAQCLDT